MKSRFLVLLVIFLLISAYTQIFSHDKKKWVVVKSPTRNKITNVILFPNGKAIASANKLLFYDSGTWKEFPVQPPVPAITRLNALNENHIWVAYSDPANISLFFLYRNGVWTKLEYPLANMIQDISLNANNEGWFCGDREIAYKHGGKTDFIIYPPDAYSVAQCYGTSRNNLWVTTNGRGLFHFNGKTWTIFFPDKAVKYFSFTQPGKGYVLIEDRIFEFSKGSWKLHSDDKLLNDVEKILINGNEIWGIGSKGLIVNFKKNWERIEVPVNEDLYDITFTHAGKGFIVGDKGIILEYTDKKEIPYTPQPGFDRFKIINTAKMINGEYGVVMEDFNNDGMPDIYTTCLFESNKLYINQSKENLMLFREEALSRDISGRTGEKKFTSQSDLFLGSGSADIDNDGDQDLYICNLSGENKLFLNNGRGYFREVSSENDRATDRSDRTNCAVFSDIDNDGDLDLFLCNEFSTNRLYENDGHGYFTEVTSSAGIETQFGGMGAVFADVDNDNYSDLYVVNWSKPNILYRNITFEAGRIKFIEVTQAAGVSGGEIKKSNAAVFGDYDNDGDVDLFVTNRKLSNRLFRNDGHFIFRDVTESVLGSDSLLSYGANMADFDNDGYLDLYTANVGENRLYKNMNGKKFAIVTHAYGVGLSGYSTGSACGDIDNDGDVDLYSADYINGSSVLFINNINDRNYINVSVTGMKSNRDAVGTKLWLYKAGELGNSRFLCGYREISGGSGYSSKDSREVHFGVKKGLYDLVVFFPASGITKRCYGLASGNKISVTEIEGFNGTIASVYRTSTNFIFDRENQKEAVKFIFATILIMFTVFYGIKKYRWRINYTPLLFIPVYCLYFFQIAFLRYENFLYSTIIPLASVITALLAVHYYYERKSIAERVLREKEKTRDVLARDLHDDLASTISSAMIYLDLLKIPDFNEKTQLLLGKVHNLLKEAAHVVTDIIWTVSPRHDNIEDLISRLQILMDDLCRANSIEFQSQFDLKDSDFKIEDVSRRNIYLIYKEAINNIIKHASATKVNFNVQLENNLLNFSLYDNGIGFDCFTDFSDLSKASGNGLRNIKVRAGEINAEVQIRSVPMKGTYINLSQKIK